MLMKEYLAAFGAIPNIRGEHWQKIIGYFPDLKSAWSSKTGELLEAGLPEKWIDEFLDFRNQVTPSEVMEELKKNKIDIIAFDNPGYPVLLKEISSPPYLLYIRGELKPEDQNAIGIVGSRKGTDYGRRATYEIAEGLGKAGITVISGLAIGLDTEAHRGALAGGGRTIAVLANGLDAVYPSSNQNLAEQIIDNGCLISEQPFGMPPLKHNFPARNRIISGLSQGVLVTEAGEASGTLHTASFAIEQNRQLYAIPGPIYNPLAKGPNNLLKQGAKAVTCAQDILEDFGIESSVTEILPVGEDEELIFKILKTENLHIDDIVRLSERDPADISKILTLMELRGKIRNLGGQLYSLK